MSEIKQLEDKEVELNNQISNLGKQRSHLRQRLALLRSEFKVGDRVRVDKRKEVYQISSITPGYGKEPHTFGRKIKKDGTPGSREHRIYVWHGEKLVSA